MATVKFPGATDRLAVLGSSGSGKTTAAAWHLSGKNFNKQPWVIVNTKGDPLIAEIAEIPGVQTIGINDTPGDEGLYIINPLPEQQMELDSFFRRVWDKQNIGVWVDEGYMIEETGGFNALLTQGRSRRIPMIVLSQRPSWISKFVFSEANFVQVFRLGHLADRKNVGQFVPMDPKARLPNHHSFWYNVNDDILLRFGPVPKPQIILENIRAAFPPDNAQSLDQPVLGPKQEVTARRFKIL